MKKIKRWLERLFRRTPELVLNYGATVETFKSEEGRIAHLRVQLRDPIMREALSVVLNASPPHLRYADPNAAMFDLGVMRGMREAVLILNHLAEPVSDESETLEPTWGVPEEGEESEA
jgi:hypothetical protein